MYPDYSETHAHTLANQFNIIRNANIIRLKKDAASKLVRAYTLGDVMEFFFLQYFCNADYVAQEILCICKF